MTKRLLTLLLSIMLFTSIATAEHFESGGIYYNITGTNTVEVTSGSNQYTGSVVIPSVAHHIYYTYDYYGNPIQHDDAYTVTSIDSHAFQYCSGLTSVTIPNSVTTIGIGGWAFAYCTGLKRITIPNSVTEIGVYAFYGCSGLKSVSIGNSVTFIEEATFAYCTGLKSITIPNSVTSIDYLAFNGCSGLTSVTIPNSVTEIDDFAFSDCTGLESVTIPNSVTSIGDGAFHGCSGLTSVTIGNSVTSIEDQAFSGCSGLKTVNWNAKRADFTSSNSPFIDLTGITGITTFNIGNEVERIPSFLCAGLKGITNITIPNSVTEIGGYAFEDCTGLTSITIPNSVTSIGGGAFEGCSGLTSITIPNSVTSISYGAFAYCSGLTSVTIPNSVTSIGGEAFYRCSGLTSITIPSSVTSIGYEAFYRCTGLRNIYSQIRHPENVALGSWVFTQVPKDVCTLHVPRGTVPVYRRCEQWKDFLNIVDDVDGTTTIVIPATALELNPKHLVLHPGESADITAVFTPQYPTVTLLDWASDNREVATVNGKGHVTALKTGRVTISATTIDLSDITATCTLQVVPEGASVVPGDVDGSAMVDVDDVNAMINLILLYDQYKDKYPGSADLDGNGMVDVDDVNALINMILAK